MIKLKTKYRFAAFILLTAILSHIAIFHFSLTNKVICEDEGESFHIENTISHHIPAENSSGIERINNAGKSFGIDNELDVHLDKNIVKSNNNYLIRFSTIFILNSDKTIKHKNLNYYQEDNFFTVNTVLKNISTVTLII